MGINYELFDYVEGLFHEKIHINFQYESHFLKLGLFY